MNSATRMTILAVTMIVFLIVLAFCGTVHAQDKDGSVIPSYLPQLYIAPGVSLMPNGYAAVAYRGEVGFTEDYKHLVAGGYMAYDNGHKTNDGTADNFHGHDRYISGFVALRPRSNTYYGFGWDWSQLMTTNYTKGLGLFDAVRNGDVRAEAVAGHDWIRSNFSMTGQVNYVFAPFHESIAYPGNPPTICQGCGNGVQGPEFHVWFPSKKPGQCRIHLPAGCLLFEEVLGIYEFHDTYTIPGGYPGEKHRHLMSTADFKIIYRF